MNDWLGLATQAQRIPHLHLQLQISAAPTALKCRSEQPKDPKALEQIRLAIPLIAAPVAALPRGKIGSTRPHRTLPQQLLCAT